MTPPQNVKSQGLLYCTWVPARAKDLEVTFDTLQGGPVLMAFLQSASHLSPGTTSRLDLRDAEVQRKAARQLGSVNKQSTLPSPVVADALCITLLPPTKPAPVHPNNWEPRDQGPAAFALLRSHGYVDDKNRPTMRCAEDAFCEGDVIEELFAETPQSQVLTDLFLTSFPATGSVEITPAGELHLYVNALDCQKLRREVWRRIGNPSPYCDYTLADDPGAGGYRFAFTSNRHGSAANHLVDIFCLEVRQPKAPDHDARQDFLLAAE